MHFAFIDDSQQKAPRSKMRKRLVALGAVVFPEDQLTCYTREVQAIYKQHEVPEGEELKWSSPKDSWFRNEGAPVLTTVREACLDAARRCEANAVVVIFDTGRISLNEDRVTLLVLEMLYERIEMMVCRPQPNRVVLICDKPGGDHKDEDAWIRGRLSITAAGTQYVQPENVALPVLTAPSHHHPHLQLADLVTGSLTAAVGGKPWGQALVPKVKPLLHTNTLGTIGGTGLKLWPDELTNLYHWVLGEDAYTKVRSGSGFLLPHHSYPYADSDGIRRRVKRRAEDAETD